MKKQQYLEKTLKITKKKYCNQQINKNQKKWIFEKIVRSRLKRKQKFKNFITMQKMFMKEQICRYNMKRFCTDVSQCCFLSKNYKIILPVHLKLKKYYKKFKRFKECKSCFWKSKVSKEIYDYLTKYSILFE